MTLLPKHIVVLRLSAMGDVAMTVPVLKAFVAQHPKVKVTVVSRAFFKPIFEGIENVSFYAADIYKTHKGVTGLYQLHRELSSFNVDAVADLHNVIRTKILRSFFKMKGTRVVAINKGRSEKKALVRTKNKLFKQLTTTHQRYANVFRDLGFTLNLNEVNLKSPVHLSNKAIQHFGSQQKPWIGIAPFAQYESKMYPLDLMEKVIASLVKKGVQLFLFGGGKKEVIALKAIQDKFPKVISLAGNYTFKEELAIISNLDCMLSMDSGNAHLAAMYGVKTITLWGITHPFAGFVPFNQQENCILPDLEKYPKIPCSIYGNKICDGYSKVMQSITPKNIVDKITTVIA